MESHTSPKTYVSGLVLLIGCLLAGWLVVAATAPSNTHDSPDNASLLGAQPHAALGEPYVHQNIITTVFWVGETSSTENGFIANVASAWEADWQQQYGGLDDPQKRNGFIPAALTPRENSFYVALPYYDIAPDGSRKDTAMACAAFSPLSTNSQVDNDSQPHTNHSWCKNSWIRVQYGDKTAYGQWQDVGPFEEDDVPYVFGLGRPSNNQGVRAGLDVSPAIRDYLGLEDVSMTDWSFVTPESVPEGPWKARITKSLGYTIE